MASIISAGTATNTALNITGDTTGVLALATNNGTTAVTIDTAQNVGVGVTPSSWQASSKAYEIGSGGTSQGAWGITSSGYMDIMRNAYIATGGTSTYKYSSYATMYRQDPNGLHVWYNAPSGTAGNAITFTQAMTLDASGNLGVGTSSPGTSNTAGISFIPGTASYVSATGSNGSGQLLLGNNNGGSDSATDTTCGMIAFKARFNGTFGGGNDVASIVGTYTGNGTTRSGAIRFLTLNAGAEAERARIGSDGSFYVGCTTTPDGTSGGSAFYTQSVGRRTLRIATTTSGGAGLAEFVNPNGLVGTISTSGSATTYGTSSDYRLKNSVAPMTGALAKVAALKPCTYKWNADGSDGEGFIAHELAEVVPQCVTGEKDAVDSEGKPVYQGIDTSFLVATLTAAIQELKTIVDAQAVEIAALKAKVGS